MKKVLGTTFFAMMLAGSVAYADDAATQAAFDKHCKSCHGADGAGNPARAKMLKLDPEKLNLGRPESASLTKDDLKKIVTEGKEKMPSYAKKLKPEEVDPLVDKSMALAKALREKK